MRVRKRYHFAAWAMVNFIVAFVGAYAFWRALLRGRFSPGGDEFPLIANSVYMFHPKPWLWFTRGYRDYLVAYPEIIRYRSNFIRPVANVFYFVESLLFGTHWDRYFLGNVFIYSALIGLAVYIGLARLRFRYWQAALLLLSVAVVPSQDFLASAYPDACLDMLASTLILCTIICLLRFDNKLALLCVTAAVLTKETAYFAPIACMIVVFLLRNTRCGTNWKMWVAIFPTPLIAIWVLRSLAFRKATVTGVYYFAGDHALLRALKLPLLGITLWPFDIYAWSLYHLFLRRALHLLCLIFWIALVTASVFLRKDAGKYLKGEVPRVTSSVSLLVIIVFAWGALLMPTFLALPARFGAVFFPLFCLLSVAFSFSRTSSPFVRVCWAAMLAASLFLGIRERMAIRQQVAAAYPHWILDKSFMNELHGARAPLLFVVDDATDGDAGIEWSRIVSGYPGYLVRVNDFVIGSEAKCTQVAQLAKINASTFSVHYTKLRACGQSRFNTQINPLPHFWCRNESNGVRIDYIMGRDGFEIDSATIHLPASTTALFLRPNFSSLQYESVRLGDGAPKLR